MRTVAIVPVRAGSKGLPGKNTALLGGMPLWARAVAQGRAVADEVVVSTDMKDIFQDVVGAGATCLPRPAALSQDDTPMAPVLLDVLDQIAGEARIVLLQATSPLRSEADIQQAIKLHKGGAFDLVMSVTETSSAILKYGTMEADRFVPVSQPDYCFSNRQSLPTVMRPNGAVYIFDRAWFLANGGFATQRIGAVVMPAERSFDIDTEDDLVRAEAALSAR